MKVKFAKVYFCFAVLFLVAKPFLGFGMFTKIHPPAPKNIFLKAFTKRNLEYSENSIYDKQIAHKQLNNPPVHVFLRFSVLLGILFPLLIAVTTRNLQLNRRGLSFQEHSYLLNGKLII